MPLPSPLNTVENNAFLKQHYFAADILHFENIITQLHYLSPKLVLECDFKSLLFSIIENIHKVNKKFRECEPVIDFPFLVCGAFLLSIHNFFSENRLDNLIKGGRKFFTALSFLYRMKPCLFTEDNFDKLACEFNSAYERVRAFIFFHEIGLLENNVGRIMELFKVEGSCSPLQGTLLLSVLEKIFKYAPELVTQERLEDFFQLSFRETLLLHGAFVKIVNERPLLIPELFTEAGITLLLQKCSARIEETLKETPVKVSVSFSAP